jgi:integrase
MPLRLWRRTDDRSGNWYIIGTVPVWRDGKLRLESFKQTSTRTADRAEAEGILLQVAVSYQRGNVENRDTPKTVGDLVNAYLDAGKSERYLIPVIKALGNLEAGRLTQQLIDREGRKAYPGVKPATLRRQWHGVINAVLHHSKIHLDLELPEASPVATRWTTPAKADAIIRACAAGRTRNPWAPVMAELLYGTGARADEAMSLDMADLDLDHGFVIYRDTKNGSERTVPLLPRTIAALARLPNLGEPGLVFRKATGREYTERKTLRGHKLGVLRGAAERAGVPDFHPHMTRHSFATWFYVQTKDALRLKATGGWNTDSAMQRYTHLVPLSVGLEAIRLGWDFREHAIETPAAEGRKQA